ncbi:MAG: KGG domain-containing protein [Labilithrix sp.]
MSIDENTPKDPNEATTPVPAEPATPAAPTTQAATTTTEGVTPPTEQPKPRRRGFAAMDRDRVKEIASKGGRAAHAAGTAHQFNPDEARVAGKKGGLAPHVRRGGVRRRPITEAAAPNSQQGSVDGR